MNNINLLKIGLIVGTLTFGMSSYCEETKFEKAETISNKTGDNIKRFYRSAKDKTCEMINGKMECVEKKIINKAKNLSDKAKTEAKELKNKAD